MWKMGPSRFLSALLIALFLVLCFSHGFARNPKETTIKHDEDPMANQVKESEGKSRELIQLMDYSDPGPNTKHDGGYISPPPRG